MSSFSKTTVCGFFLAVFSHVTAVCAAPVECIQKKSPLSLFSAVPAEKSSNSLMSRDDEIKTLQDESPSKPLPERTAGTAALVYVGGYGSYGAIDGMYNSDGQFASYRFNLGVEVAYWRSVAFGFEGGVQSGNAAPVEMNAASIAKAGGLVPHADLKTFLDLLAVIRWNFVTDFHLLVKGGIAYRQFQFTDRTSSQDALYRVNGEFQWGLGYQLTCHARLVALYQGIYSASSAGLTLDANDNVLMQNIPTQQAGLLGIEYTF